MSMFNNNETSNNTNDDVQACEMCVSSSSTSCIVIIVVLVLTLCILCHRIVQTAELFSVIDERIVDGRTGLDFTYACHEHVKYTTPVVVFVHGWTYLRSKVWDDMSGVIPYDEYRCVWVLLDYTGSMRKNGTRLTDVLRRVTELFRVDRVVIVAHSKGGLDVQAALLYDGARRYIDRVITLSTPHWGSPLADMVYLPLVRDVPIVRDKFLCDALRDMRTSEMSEFRKRFDNDPDVNDVPFVTIAGTGTHREKAYYSSILKRVMNGYGDNDDLVVARMARKPGAVDLGTVPYGHEHMTSARVWFKIEPHIVGVRRSLDQGGGGLQCSTTFTPMSYDATPSRSTMVFAILNAFFVMALTVYFVILVFVSVILCVHRALVSLFCVQYDTTNKQTLTTHVPKE